MNKIRSESVKLRAKRTFQKKGTCSPAFFYILDREFGYPLDDEETDFEMECSKICGQSFNAPEEHTEFLHHGGCKKLMGVLANSESMEGEVN